MKKFNSILAIAAIAVSSVFGLTSCDKENDGFNEAMKPRTEFVNNTETEQASEVQKNNYEVNGMWRFESNGKKYTLYVDVPAPEKGGFRTVNFFFDGKCIVGNVTVENDVMTFTSNANQKANVVIKAKFANNDSQQFVAEEMTIDNTTEATNATFTRIETPSNYGFTVCYTVVDPDNELASKGIDIQQLNEEVKKYESTVQTNDKNPIKAAGTMFVQKGVTDIALSLLMSSQKNKYPELATSKAYIETHIVESFGDVSYTMGENSFKYSAETL